MSRKSGSLDEVEKDMTGQMTGGDVHLRQLMDTAAAHASARTQGDDAAAALDRSWAAICAASVRAFRALGEDGVARLVAIATSQGLVPGTNRTRTANRLHPLLRIAAGKDEKASTISRAASVAEHIVQKKLDLETVLGPCVSFWKLYNSIMKDRKHGTLTSTGMGTTSTLRLCLDRELVAAFRAGTHKLVLTSEAGEISAMILPVAATDIAQDIPSLTNKPRAAMESGGTELAHAEQTSIRMPSSGECPGAGVDSPPRDRQSPVSPYTAALDSRVSAVLGPLVIPNTSNVTGGPHRHDTKTPTILRIAFTGHVKACSNTDYDALRAAGRFVKAKAAGGEIWAWEGYAFPELADLMSRHGGKILSAAPSDTDRRPPPSRQEPQ